MPLEKLPSWQENQFLNFRPLIGLKGELPILPRLDVAVPKAHSVRYAKGEQFLLFLTALESSPVTFWRPVSALAIQPRDTKLEELLVELGASHRVHPSSITIVTNWMHGLYGPIPRVAPATYLPGKPSPADDPGAMEEYRRRVEAMPGRLPLPTLRASKIEQLMESGGSR
jgi:hypothetical protein